MKYEIYDTQSSQTVEEDFDDRLTAMHRAFEYNRVRRSTNYAVRCMGSADQKFRLRVEVAPESYVIHMDAAEWRSMTDEERVMYLRDATVETGRLKLKYEVLA